MADTIDFNPRVVHSNVSTQLSHLPIQNVNEHLQTNGLSMQTDGTQTTSEIRQQQPVERQPESQSMYRTEELRCAASRKDDELVSLRKECEKKDYQVMYMRSMLNLSRSTSHLRFPAHRSSSSRSAMVPSNVCSRVISVVENITRDIEGQMKRQLHDRGNDFPDVYERMQDLSLFDPDLEASHSQPEQIQISIDKDKAVLLLTALNRSIRPTVKEGNSATDVSDSWSGDEVDMAETTQLRNHLNDLNSRYNKLQHKTETLQRAFRQSQHTIKLLQKYYEEEKQNNAAYDEGLIFKMWSYMAIGVCVHVAMAKFLNKIL